jgi:hypothetical protein
MIRPQCSFFFRSFPAGMGSDSMDPRRIREIPAVKDEFKSGELFV